MADIFLIAPPDAAPQTLEAALRPLLDDGAVKALLLPRGSRSEGDYKSLVKTIAPLAQSRDIAVLIEGDPGEVKKLGVDGLHVAGSIEAMREAIAALKPGFIVGAADLRTKDDAMAAGELGVDYVFFGPFSGPTDDAARELARWWAETMEVPSVLSDPGATAGAYDAEGCEFIGLGDGIFGGAEK